MRTGKLEKEIMWGALGLLVLFLFMRGWRYNKNVASEKVKPKAKCGGNCGGYDPTGAFDCPSGCKCRYKEDLDTEFPEGICVSE